jgi:hypothetical protein
VTLAPAPRQFFSNGMLPGSGLPHDRASRIAARRAFVESLQGERGDWLRQQIRSAEEPGELWLLRASVMEALSQRDESTRQWRAKLRRSLGTLFPDTELCTGFGALAAG